VLAFSAKRWPERIAAARAGVLPAARWDDALPAVIRGLQNKAALLAEFAGRNGVRAAKGLVLGLPGDLQPTTEGTLDAARTTITGFMLTRADMASTAAGRQPREPAGARLLW